MKKLLSILVLITFAMLWTSCDAIDKAIKDLNQPTTPVTTNAVTVNLSDETGDLSWIKFQIIDPVSSITVPFQPRVRYNQTVLCHNQASYEFTNIPAGSYAGLLDTLSETYQGFTINQGEHITLNYVYHVSGYTVIGDPFKGYTAIPKKRWGVSVARN